MKKRRWAGPASCGDVARRRPWGAGRILPGGTAPEQLELAVLAEQAGWDGVYVWEAGYGVDAWTLLAAMATRTTRVRLGTMLTPLPWRRPWKLASQVAPSTSSPEGRAMLAIGLARSPPTCRSPGAGRPASTGGDDGRGHRPDPHAVVRAAGLPREHYPYDVRTGRPGRWAARCRSGSRSGWSGSGRAENRCGGCCAATA